MALVANLIGKGEAVENHRPFPRASVSPEVWTSAAKRLALGELCLLGLWGEPDRVHMALLDETDGETEATPRSGCTTRRRCGWSAPRATCSAWSPQGCPIHVPG